MNWLDILLGLILTASALAGIRTGFIRAAMSMATAILAVVFALWFHGAAGSLVAEYVSSKKVADFLGFTFVIILVLIAGALLGRLLAALLRWAGLGWIDRLLGGCLGLLRGLIVSLAIVVALMAFSLNPPPRAVARSRIAPYLMEAARVVALLAPRELAAGFQNSYQRLRRLWEETWTETGKLKTSEH